MIVIRAKDAGMSASTWDAIVAGGILAADGAHVIYRVEGGRNGARVDRTSVERRPTLGP